MAPDLKCPQKYGFEGKTVHYQLILSDIDGTLLNDGKQLLFQTKQAVEGIVASGILFATASIRTKSFTRRSIGPLVNKCCGNSYLCGSLVEASDGTVLADYPLENEAVALLMEECNRRKVSFCCVSQDEAAAKVFEKGVEGPFNSYHGEYFEMSTIAAHALPVYIFVVVAEEPNVMVEFAWEKGLGLNASPSLLNPNTGLEEIFFLKKGVNKGTALECLAAHYGVALPRTVAIGDDPWVDGPMIELAGCGIAMKNAPPALHALADCITEADNNEDGVGIFLRSLQDGKGKAFISSTRTSFPCHRIQCI
jgi:HAD superfamily hydrolase (TIGR01484 family)